MTHANAPFTPEGRLRIVRTVVDDGWSIRRTAERFQCSPAMVAKWVARYRAGEPMTDRSSRPKTSPTRSCRRLEHRIVGLRVTRRWGPHRIGYHLGIPRSTVWRVLHRYRMPLLAHLDQATGLPVRRPRPVPFDASRPGERIHIDIKKLGRIPDGGGWRKMGRTTGNRNNKRDRPGYAYLHHAVDAYSRLAYSEQLDDERKETAAGFYQRARDWFADAGIVIESVMTDNGACYRSKTFAAALGPDVVHKRTRPYRPQTNGKVERFNRTLATKWAYAEIYRSDAARAATYADWIHSYNHHRPHTGIGGLTPAQRVHNLTGNYN